MDFDDAYESYELGDSPKVSGVFKDSDGVEADPSVVNLSVRDPSGNVVTYVYGTDAEVVRTSAGNYYAVLDADESGFWYYRWWSTGTGKTAGSHRFFVKEELAIES